MLRHAGSNSRCGSPRAVRVLGACLALLVFSVPRPGVAAESGSGSGVGRAARVAVDVFPIRFGSFLQLLVGGVFMVPATLISGLVYPFERNPGVFRENAERFVIDPFDYTFRRPIGENFEG